MTISPATLIHLLKRDLAQGEAEVIALAVEGQAEVVLLDESDARQVADVFGLRKKRRERRDER